MVIKMFTANSKNDCNLQDTKAQEQEQFFSIFRLL